MLRYIRRLLAVYLACSCHPETDVINITLWFSSGGLLIFTITLLIVLALDKMDKLYPMASV